MPAVRQRSNARRTPSASAGVDRAFSAELIRVIYERDAKCPDCRYSLNGLTTSRCPECGRSVAEFLRVVDTMPRRWAMLRKQMFDRRLRAILLVLVLALAATVVGYALANLL